MAFYIKYPPNGDTHFRRPDVTGRQTGDGTFVPPEWDPCTFGTDAEHASTTRELKFCRHEWNATGNRLHVLEAFRLSCSARLYPPMWVLAELDACFKRAVTKQWSLDRAFGFSGEGLGKGKRPSQKEVARLRRRDKLICMAVWKLEGAGLTRRQACKALAGLLARLPDRGRILIGGDSLSALRGINLSGKRIEAVVAQCTPLWRDEEHATAEASRTWSVEDKTKMLSIFFPAELPRGFGKNLAGK